MVHKHGKNLHINGKQIHVIYNHKDPQTTPMQLTKIRVDKNEIHQNTIIDCQEKHRLLQSFWGEISFIQETEGVSALPTGNSTHRYTLERVEEIHAVWDTPIVDQYAAIKMNHSDLRQHK